jgi:hypothetical protein
MVSSVVPEDIPGGGGIETRVAGGWGQSGDNDDTTRHLSGRSVRMLASGLAFGFWQAGCQHGNAQRGNSIRQLHEFTIPP